MSTSTAAPPRFPTRERFEAVWDYALDVSAAVLVEGVFLVGLIITYAMLWGGEMIFAWMQGVYLAQTIQDHAFVAIVMYWANNGIAISVGAAGCIAALKHFTRQDRVEQHMAHKADTALKGRRHHGDA